MKHFFQTKMNRGFTIVETLFAVLILAFVVTGPMVFTSQSLKTATYARDQLVAFYMTQETIELIKNARDNKAIASLHNSACQANINNKLGWLNCNTQIAGDLRLENCLHDPSNPARARRHCYLGLDKTMVPIATTCSNPLSTTSCPFVIKPTTINSAGDPIARTLIYAHGSTDSTWKSSPYKRVVSIMPVSGNESREVEITVSIYWKSGLTNRHFTVRQNITNWLPLSPTF